jgi:hypothetical protein
MDKLERNVWSPALNRREFLRWLEVELDSPPPAYSPRARLPLHQRPCHPRQRLHHRRRPRHPSPHQPVPPLQPLHPRWRLPLQQP